MPDMNLKTQEDDYEYEPPNRGKNFFVIIIAFEGQDWDKDKRIQMSAEQNKILGQKLSYKIRFKNSKIKKENEVCSICFENTPNAVLMYCGHGGICNTCAFEVVDVKNECHLCRQEVYQIVEVIFPNNYKDIYQALCVTDIIVDDD